MAKNTAAKNSPANGNAPALGPMVSKIVAFAFDRKGKSTAPESIGKVASVTFRPSVHKEGSEPRVKFNLYHAMELAYQRAGVTFDTKDAAARIVKLGYRADDSNEVFYNLGVMAKGSSSKGKTHDSILDDILG